MAFSCSDFTDAVLEALKIEVPEEARDDPQWQADLACTEINRLQEEIVELQAIFDLQWKADLRAIKRWQQAGTGRELTLPDRADLCVWLLEQLEIPTDPERTAEQSFRALVQAARDWGERCMDQWEKFKIKTPKGTIYVRIALEDEYPDSYDEVQPAFLNEKSPQA